MKTKRRSSDGNFCSGSDPLDGEVKVWRPQSFEKPFRNETYTRKLLVDEIRTKRKRMSIFFFEKQTELRLVVTRPDTSSESSERDSSSDNGSGTGFGGHSDDEDDIWSETESWPTEEEAGPPSPTPTLAPPSTPGGENGDYKKKHVEVDEVEFDEIDVIRPDFGPDEDPDSSVLFANHLLVIVLYSGIVGCLASCILVALCVIGARKCRQKQYGMNEEGSESTASSDLPIIKGQHHNGQRGKGGQVKVTTNPYCVDGRSHYGRRNSFSPTPLPDLSLPPDDPKKKRKLSGSGGGCFGKKGPKDDDTIYTRSRNISACDQDKSIYARTTTSSSSKPKQQTDWL